MPFDCNCHGINFQKEFADAAQTKLRVEDALDKTFTDIGLSVPDDKTALREALLADGGTLYEVFYEHLLDCKPGCMRACTNTLMYILSHADTDIDDSKFTELRSTKIPDDVENAATERREIARQRRQTP